MARIGVTPEILEQAAREYIKTNKLVQAESTRGYGHEVGTKLEKYSYDMLREGLPHIRKQIKTYWPHDFLNELQTFHQMRSLDHIKIILDAWWHKLLLSGNPKNENYSPTQGMGADLVCHYGVGLADFDDVILINVKSRNTERRGRDPNIISAYKLLTYFSNMRSLYPTSDHFDKTKYWLLGFEHKSGLIQNVYVKDLFKLDVSKMPRVNFDSAMQIQWHVSKMEVLPNQTTKEFMSNFTKKFNDDWDRHMQSRNRDIQKITDSINKPLQADGV